MWQSVSHPAVPALYSHVLWLCLQVRWYDLRYTILSSMTTGCDANNYFCSLPVRCAGVLQGHEASRHSCSEHTHSQPHTNTA
jgi:hypothetical protein